MCILFFSTTFTWKISHSKKNSGRYCHECENVFMQSTRYSWRFLMKVESSRRIFEKGSYMKFHQNPPSGNRVVLCGQTDMTELIVALRSFANAPKKLLRLFTSGFVRKRVKRRFLILNVSAGNITLASNMLPAKYGLSGYVVLVVLLCCAHRSRVCCAVSDEAMIPSLIYCTGRQFTFSCKSRPPACRCTHRYGIAEWRTGIQAGA